MEKATLGFGIYKLWQILKHFAGTFRPAQTLKLGGVTHSRARISNRLTFVFNLHSNKKFCQTENL